MAQKIATSLRREVAGDILAKPPPHSILSPQLTLLPSPKPSQGQGCAAGTH